MPATALNRSLRLDMKSFRRAVSALLAVLIVASAGVIGASADDVSVLTVKSAQSVFEPFTYTVPEKGATVDIVFKLRSDLKIVDAGFTLGFDSDKLEVRAYRYGKRIFGGMTNISDEWQKARNNVATQISAGGSFFDFADEDVLIRYTVKVFESSDLTLDFDTLTANNTVLSDGKEQIDPNGDVSLVRFGKLEKNFSCSAEVKPTMGDVNFDGKVDINDATLVQLYTLDLAGLADEQLVRAYVYADGSVTIRDVTKIQLYLVNRIEEL